MVESGILTSLKLVGVYLVMKSLQKLYNAIDKRSLFLYLLVGGSSAFIYFGAFSFFYAIANLHYKWALTIGFFLSTVFNFLANRHLTFQSQTNAAHAQLVKYTILLIINYVLNFAVAHFCVSFLFFSPYWAVIVAIGSVVPLNYVMSKYWVFSTDKC